MKTLFIKPFNVIDNIELPEVQVDRLPTDGDPIEVKGEMYYVCEYIDMQKRDPSVIGVIPLVVRNPSTVVNIESYIKCLSLAHRKVQFRNEKGVCDLGNCDEMVIT